jgi:membrane-associated protease RseP (regulator of RpoE activity)
MLWIFIGFIVVVTVIHELAHAFFMMRNKVEMKTIALGFPPLVLKKQVTIKRIQEKPITLGLSPFLLGAYVNPTKEGQKYLDSLPLDKKLLIYGAGVVSHFILIPSLLIVPYLFDPTWHLSVVSWGIAATSGVLSLLFFVRPLFASVAILAVGSLFLGAIVWSILAVGLGQTAVGPIGMGLLAGEASTFAKMFTLLFAVSLTLGAANAMPMMPVDGGHMLFAFLEKFIDAQKLLRIKIAAMLIGWVVLLSFFAFILMRDFSRVWSS